MKSDAHRRYHTSCNQHKGHDCVPVVFVFVIWVYQTDLAHVFLAHSRQNILLLYIRIFTKSRRITIHVVINSMVFLRVSSWFGCVCTDFVVMLKFKSFGTTGCAEVYLFGWFRLQDIGFFFLYGNIGIHNSWCSLGLKQWFVAVHLVQVSNLRLFRSIGKHEILLQYYIRLLIERWINLSESINFWNLCLFTTILKLIFNIICK